MQPKMLPTKPNHQSTNVQSITA